jgi:hypothetical protein
MTETEGGGTIHQLKRRLRQRDATKRAPDLWAATRILMGLRYSDAVVPELLRGVVAME